MGFPSPAQDYIATGIDLNKELIQQPASTFFATVSADALAGDGIGIGDIVVIDKAIEPCSGDVAVCVFNGEFMLRRLRFLSSGIVRLCVSHPCRRHVDVSSDADFSIWGVVTYVLKPLRRQ